MKRKTRSDRGPLVTRSKILRYAMHALLLVLVFMGVAAFHARNMLSPDEQAVPALTGQTIGGQRFELDAVAVRPTLIYFFAPWCLYCKASTDNIVRLRKLRTESSLSIVMVALDWESIDAVQAYALDHDVNVPVVLGDAAIAKAWKIHGFPSYYVVSNANRIAARDFGYSTQLGLLLRTWL